MVLYISTDQKNIHWLKYIAEQFVEIQKAEFSIEVVSLSDLLSTNSKFVIAHTAEPYLKKNTVFDCGNVEPTGNLEYPEEDFFLLEGSRGHGFDIDYDLFWNAFVFLSRFEEYLAHQRGDRIYSYAARHPRKDKDSFNIPIVNILFNRLEIFISEKFQSFKFGSKEKMIIDFSHDIDYIEKTFQLRIKQTAFNFFNTLKAIPDMETTRSIMKKTARFLFYAPSYWCFDYWEDFEKRHNIRSTFYVYAKVGSRNFRSWLIDPSYDVATNFRLRDKLRELHEEGFDIGLHGSYRSALSYDRLQNEKEVLENSLGIKVSKTRQHWLNYDEDVTPYAHERLFAFDSTIGWNDRMGFRAGVASLYNPYDHKNKKNFSYKVIPQIIMDSHLYDYSKTEHGLLRAKKVLDIANKQAKGPFFSISWHQRVCSSDYLWNKTYEELTYEYL
jgi:peptidoglycan/xylan/chitin deacetylase (PgdA/CDA1 family)